MQLACLPPALASRPICSRHLWQLVLTHALHRLGVRVAQRLGLVLLARASALLPIILCVRAAGLHPHSCHAAVSLSSCSFVAPAGRPDLHAADPAGGCLPVLLGAVGLVRVEVPILQEHAHVSVWRLADPASPETTPPQTSLRPLARHPCPPRGCRLHLCAWPGPCARCRPAGGPARPWAGCGTPAAAPPWGARAGQSWWPRRLPERCASAAAAPALVRRGRASPRCSAQPGAQRQAASGGRACPVQLHAADVLEQHEEGGLHAGVM